MVGLKKEKENFGKTGVFRRRYMQSIAWFENLVLFSQIHHLKMMKPPNVKILTFYGLYGFSIFFKKENLRKIYKTKFCLNG